jgi:hypothetical protein
MRSVLHGIRQLGPYALVVLLVPGGSAIALLMWLWRRRMTKSSERRFAGISEHDAI